MKWYDQAAQVLGIWPHQRQDAVETLYLTTERHPMVYWLQLLIATGIAHLGLVLNSTAVVIGAMLVSPLMTPIVQLGMAFTIGNLYFAAKAALKILLSFLVVVGFAAVMTKSMPFEQVTSEVLSRTQPTALDLIVALFCGLAAAFSTARASRDTVTAAAGTAIAIALVPPLCVVGFGVGIGSKEIALGANLLFIANLAAIILISNLFFYVTGFATVNVNDLESKVLDEDDRKSRLFRMTKGIKVSSSRSRWQTFRVFLPLVFVVLVMFPLSEALKRVAWEVNVKKGISAVLSAFEQEYQVLSRYQVVSHGTVSVRLTIVGEPGEEEEISQNLKLKIATIAGTEPNVTLEIIPSKEFMAHRFDESNEWVKQQLADLQLEQTAPQMLSPEEAAKNLPPTYFHKQLADVMTKVMTFIRANDKNADWLEWSIDIGNRGTKVTIHRIADSDLPESARSLMTGVLQRETGIQATLKESRIGKTIFQTDDSNTARLPKKKIAEKIAVALNDPAVGVVAALPDPEKAKTPYEKNRWKRMNAAITAHLETIVPAARLVKEESGHDWCLTFTNMTARPEPGAGMPAPASAQEKKDEKQPVKVSDSKPQETEKAAELTPEAKP